MGNRKYGFQFGSSFFVAVIHLFQEKA